jgi:hypothetical protein
MNKLSVLPTTIEDIVEIRCQVDRQQVNKQKRIESEFHVQLNKFEEQQKRDEQCC